ncbi:MAG: Gfo/Idh/MocA family protein [Jatrophihabitans sp.]
MPVSVGVLGVGVMGAEHARLLAHVVAGSEVRAVFDVDRGRAATVAGAYGAQALDDPMVLVKDDAVDAVLIASSDRTHEQFVLACLAAGKPVLCEKPLAPDVAGCMRILQAESDIGRRLISVGFMRRYDPGYADLKLALSDGSIGPALMLHCIHRNARSAGQPSSELISGSAVHEIDIARWLLGEELVSVTAHRPRPSERSGGAQDPMLLVFSAASGVLVDVEVFVNAEYGYDVRCELVGEHGAIALDTLPPTTRRTSGQITRTVPADWRARFREAYRRELQAWVDGPDADDYGQMATAWDGYVAAGVATSSIRALETGHPQQIERREMPALYR